MLSIISPDNVKNRKVGIVLLNQKKCILLPYFSLICVMFFSCTFLFSPQTVNANPTAVQFDDSDPHLIKLSGSEYELHLRKSNGSIAALIDKTTGPSVTEGSRHDCLWWSYGDSLSSGGCLFQAGSGNAFSYSWSPHSQVLTLTYTGDPTLENRMNAVVRVMPSGENFVDMQITVENLLHDTQKFVLFPCDLVFNEDEIQAAYLPLLPGIKLLPAFFDQNRTFSERYPGAFFADFMVIESTSGVFSLYAHHTPDRIYPAQLGLIHDGESAGDQVYNYHTIGAQIPYGGTWTSMIVRLETASTPLETMIHFRELNIAGSLPSLQEKAGDLWDELARAPLYKADAAHLDMPFNQYSDLLDQVPAPGLLHPVAFQLGGHDQNYPDFLPPEPRFGTTAQMAAMFQDAQNRGFLVMPYINPTWWDDESPTLQNLPVGTSINDLAVLNSDGQPIYETYGVNGGYAISPYPTFVQNRLSDLMTTMTTTLPSDLILEDQIGARSWYFDFNPAAPHPTSYAEGWLAHTRTYQSSGLMTERGFDRLAETMLGFHGSILLDQVNGYTDGWLGVDTWESYPMSGVMLRDKILTYQHDLAMETFTHNQANLVYNLAFGFQLSYDLHQSQSGGGLDSPWLDVVGVFQREVLSTYADALVVGYGEIAADVTQTTFETVTVTVNGSETASFSLLGHTLPPGGALVQSACGGLTAGIFTTYNKQLLSSGEHILVEKREADQITLWQPLGADTNLTLNRPASWTNPHGITLLALDEKGAVLAGVPFSLTAEAIGFTYQRAIGGGDAAAYVLRYGPQITFLPFLKR